MPLRRVRYASVLVRLDPTSNYDGQNEDWCLMRDWAVSVGDGVRVDLGPGLSDEAKN